MFRNRRATRQHAQHTDQECPFCKPPTQKIIRETRYVRVLQNTFPYNFWEFRDVLEHYLVVPKRHVKSLGELTAEEQRGVMALLAEYEAQNFNVYARSSNSVQRTIPLHQHTHLIKTSDNHARAAIYSKKPYFVAKI